MKYTDFERALSVARLSKYLNACGGNKVAALNLYRSNIKLCQKFYGLINVFEVILRNAINNHYITYFSDTDWIIHQIESALMLDSCPYKGEIQNNVITLTNRGRYSNDRIVSSVTFGFWTYLFTRTPFRLGGQSLHRIFPNRTLGLGQRAIYNELMEIKRFRNRIAHHEAVCFDASGNKDTTYAKESYALILKYVEFLGYKKEHLYYGMDVLPDTVIEKIDNM